MRRCSGDRCPHARELPRSGRSGRYLRQLASEIVPGYSHEDWFAVVAPPKTSTEIATKVSNAIAEALRLPDVTRRTGDFFVRPVGNSPTEAGAFIKSESERWRQLITSAGIRIN